MHDLARNAFTDEQKQYLEGFFAGTKQRGTGFETPALAVPAPSPPEEDDLTKEETIKRALHPFDAYPRLVADARENRAPSAEDVFRHKWNGLFYLSPIKDAYMCRLRIPGGIVRSFQLRELAAVSRELTSGYIQITTRNNFQIRLIEPKDCPEVLRRIQSVGLHSRGAGADNLRNFTANPTAGFDPHELIDVRPFVHDLSQRVISSLEFYDLPRKFNIAFDGGGLIGALEDTNDIGCTAVRVDASNPLGLPEGVAFRIKLGGVTGHKTFAADAGILVAPKHLVDVIIAMVRVFIANGDRTNRKRARLKHLLESWGVPKFIEAKEGSLGSKLSRASANAEWLQYATPPATPHSHVGVFPQKQGGKHYVGASVPVGQMSPDDLDRIADIADELGSGEIRLTVWQNFLIPDVKSHDIEAVRARLSELGYDTAPSMLRSGFVACTGSKYCKFAASDTKGHAVALMRELESRGVQLDRPVNIHFTGCPHSCAQHYIGDIGFLGAKFTASDGVPKEGYHAFVGGGFGDRREIGRQLAQNIPHESLADWTEALLRAYLGWRWEGEAFQAFCKRHDTESLRVLMGPVATSV